MDNGGQTETQTETGAEGAVVENIAGTASFTATTPEHDPMKPLETPQRPDGVPEKFWDASKGALNTEALLKSYAELEKKFSSSAQQEPDPEADPAADPAVDPDADPDPAVDPAEDPEADPKADPDADPEADPEDDPDEAPEAADLTSAMEAAQAAYAETGELSAEVRAPFLKAGITDAQIDLYIEGVKAHEAGLKLAATKAAGVEDYAEVEQAIEWAAKNWTPKKIAAFNAQAGDVETVGLAVTALFNDYRQAEPGEGRLTNVNAAVARGDIYGHKDEFAAALKAADELSDPAARRVARREVLAKQDRTLKAQRAGQRRRT